MKKLAITMGAIAILGFSTITFGTQASAATVSSSSEKQVSSGYDPLGEKYGTQEGISNPALRVENEQDGENPVVQPIITKVSNSTNLDAGGFSTMVSGWQKLGTSTFKQRSKTFYSGGGRIKIQIVQPDLGPGFNWVYYLKEDDGGVGDDLVSKFSLNNGPGTYTLEFPVDGDVDGANKKAELYLLKVGTSSASVTTTWWD